MNDSSETSRCRRPWHLWAVGLVSLLWNLMGVMDFVMTQTRNEAYLKDFTQEQLDLFFSFPPWIVGTWALATMGSVVGSLLLLTASRYALPVLAVSFASMAVNTVYMFTATRALELMGAAGVIFSAIIFIIAALLVVYAYAIRRWGILR